MDEIVAPGRGGRCSDRFEQRFGRGAGIHDVVWTLAFVDGHGGGVVTVQLGVQRLPRIVLVALGETISKFGGRAERAEVGLAGNSARDVHDREVYRAPDRGIGAETRTEAAVAGLNAELIRERTADDDGIAGRMRRDRALVGPVRRV